MPRLNRFRMRELTALAPLFVWLLFAAEVAQPPAALLADEPSSELAEYFGFRPLELFKLKDRSGNMLAGDMNHDGKTDLVLIDNSNSRIDILIQKADKPETAAKPSGTAAKPSGTVNSFKNDWRFDHRKLPVDKALAALTLGDFNGDGWTDLAYIGLPDRLVVRLQSKTGEWLDGPTFRIPDLQIASWMMSAGDLNHDGKTDLAVLGKNDTFVLYQKEDELQRPEQIMNTSDKLGLLHIGDLDGDDRADLCYIANDDSGRSLCARLQTKAGKIGPELRFDLDKPRATTLRQVDGQPGLEILSIHGQTGRLRLLQLRQPEAKVGELASQLIQYGFGRQAGSRDRDLDVGDLNADGLADVVVTDPEASQLLVFQQSPGSGLDQGSAYPCLTGATQVRIGDFLNDKQMDVVVLSPKEKSIGVTQMESGRMVFPQPVPVEKDPLLCVLSDQDGDKSPELFYLARDRNGTKTTYIIRGLKAVKEKDQLTWQPFGEPLTLALKGDPEQLLPFDADRDGITDFLLLQGSERPASWIKSDGKGGLQEIITEGGFGLGNLTASGTSIGLLDEPALMIAQNNFARQLRFNDKQQWQIMDQFTEPETSARIAGTATLNLDGEPGNEIVLVDSGVKKLRVLRREGTSYRPWREVDIGPFPFRSTHVADLNGDGLEDLLLFGGGKFGVLYANQTDPQMKELATFETSIEDAYLADVVAGDLNHDGRVDLALIETRSHHIEILDYSRELGLRHGLAFKLFESKGISEREQSQTEPRESLIADVTGDGLDDLILLSHDRVLVYPQDDGK